MKQNKQKGQHMQKRQARQKMRKMLSICMLSLLGSAFFGLGNNALAQQPPMSRLDKQLLALINQANAPSTSSSTLPPKLNHQDIYLAPNLNSASSSAVLPTTATIPSSTASTSDAAAQRCIYNNQSYISGDMVKTPQGWIRCTPTVFFTQNNPTTAQNGEAVWTKVQ